MAWKVKFEEKTETQYPPVSERPQKVDLETSVRGGSGGNKLTVSVHKVYGCCPISVEGDEFVFTPWMSLDDNRISNRLPNYMFGDHKPMICQIAMTSVFPFVQAMCLGVSAEELGITKAGEDGYVICPAWGPPTCEALTIFRLHPEPMEQAGLGAWYENLAKAGHVSVPSYYLETFGTSETKEARKRKLEEWEKAGRPKFWEGWRNPPCQPRRS